jgi:hypothetical protein
VQAELFLTNVIVCCPAKRGSSRRRGKTASVSPVEDRILLSKATKSLHTATCRSPKKLPFSPSNQQSCLESQPLSPRQLQSGPLTSNSGTPTQAAPSSASPGRKALSLEPKRAAQPSRARCRSRQRGGKKKETPSNGRGKARQACENARHKAICRPPRPRSANGLRP